MTTTPYRRTRMIAVAALLSATAVVPTLSAMTMASTVARPAALEKIVEQHFVTLEECLSARAVVVAQGHKAEPCQVALQIMVGATVLPGSSVSASNGGAGTQVVVAGGTSMTPALCTSRWCRDDGFCDIHGGESSACPDCRHGLPARIWR
jgi:hypothetical protein